MPILVALVVFVVINLFYFAPQFDGKVLAQHDILQYKGSVEDIMQHRAKYGKIRNGKAICSAGCRLT